jgi:hypothetical protein
MSAVWYCSHYLPPASLTPAANLPPVSLTPAVSVAKFAAGLIDTSLIPVVNLHLQISPRILEKFEMTLMSFLGAWGKMINEKNLKQKISLHYPLKYPEKNHRVTVRNFVAKKESFAEGCDEHIRLYCSQYETKTQPAPHTHSAAFAKVPCSQGCESRRQTISSLSRPTFR